jgi:hypothetical protein
MPDLSITRSPSERNPSELPGELDRDEEEDVDFEIPPEADDPTKEQREEEGQPPKAIEKLDLSVLPETQSNVMSGSGASRRTPLFVGSIEGLPRSAGTGTGTRTVPISLI